jgi:hypothetical protein
MDSPAGVSDTPIVMIEDEETKSIELAHTMEEEEEIVATPSDPKKLEEEEEEPEAATASPVSPASANELTKISNGLAGLISVSSSTSSGMPQEYAVVTNDKEGGKDESLQEGVEAKPDAVSNDPGMLRMWTPTKAIDGNESKTSGNENATQDAAEGQEKAEGEEENNITKMIRKAGVAVTGGALVVAGIPMIPMPTPGGVVVTGAGLAILATEFPAAQRVLDRSRVGLSNLVAESEDEGTDTEDDGRRRRKIKDKKVNATKERIATSNSNDSNNSQGRAQVDNNEGQIEASASEDSSVSATKIVSTASTKMVSTAMTSPMKIVAPTKISPEVDGILKKGDEVMKNAAVTGKRTKRSLKKFIRRNVLPLMDKVSSSSDKEPVAATKGGLVEDQVLKSDSIEVDSFLTTFGGSQDSKKRNT